MKKARLPWASAIALTGLICGASAQQEFPTFKAAPLTLVGEWEQAETVVVGNVRNIKLLRAQPSVQLSWPVSAGIYAIYWCEGDFEALATIKGPPSPDRKFVWGSAVSGCALPSAGSSSLAKGEPLTRVWFLRHEDGYLRPVVDYYARYFYDLHAAWSAGPKPEAELARLLLTPGVGGFPEPANLACSILGETECVIRIRALASLGDPNLRREACDYLASKLHLACEP